MYKYALLMHTCQAGFYTNYRSVEGRLLRLVVDKLLAGEVS